MASTKTLTLPVKGMHCASCAQLITKTLSKIDGVEQAQGFYGTEEAVITFDEQKSSVDAMNQKLKPLGYQLINDDQHQSDGHNHQTIASEEELTKEKNFAEFGLPISLFIFAGMIWEIAATQFRQLPVFPLPIEMWMLIQFILATVMFFGIGQVFIQALWSFIRYRKANMDTLVGIGTGAAYIYSLAGFFFPTLFNRFQLPHILYFDVTIVVIGFVKFGKYLESRSKRKTGEALHALLRLQAKTAIVKRGADFVEIAIDQVKIGDLIQVKPGSSIPVDGIVTEGSSAVNESMITGEAIAVEKKNGDTVVGGTLNVNGSLLITAEKIGAETVLAKIVQMVKTAQNSKAPIERIADQVSAIFIPVVLIISILTLLGWSFAGGTFMPLSQAVAYGVSCMIAVLVIACPCALGLATPTAIIVGVGEAAKKGILIKDAESLEQLHAVTTVVFDKTGTLTSGKPEVSRVIPFAQADKFKILGIAASLEAHSEHPLARAVTDYAKRSGNGELHTVTHFHNQAGEGVTGVINGKIYWLVSEVYVKQHKTYESVAFTAKPGESVLYLLNETKVLGVITVADTLKTTTKSAVAQLKGLGLKVVVLSGDRQETATYFAKLVGIDQAIGEVKPDQKLAYIEELRKNGEIVAMVGDGINDAPALAAANVGIAMSTGTDVAMSTAQATILHGDLTKVATVIALSKSVMKVIKQNLFWAFGYNIIGIPLAAGVLFPFSGLLLNPAFAGMAMGFSSVSVVMNSLRLKLIHTQLR